MRSIRVGIGISIEWRVDKENPYSLGWKMRRFRKCKR